MSFDKNKFEQDMKKFVEFMVNDLKKRGIGVSGAAFLDLSGDENTEKPTQQPQNSTKAPEPSRNPFNLPGQVDMDKVRSIMEKLKDLKEPKDGEQCFCPTCYNFETFESVLKNEGGTFDYADISLNGYKFKVKYHQDKNGKERILIQKDDTIDLRNLSDDQLQNELNEAVATKNFANAQTILNEIQKRKNKI